MSERRLNLDFIEGIIIGIYGNWLISLVDKIDFEKIQMDGFVALVASFSAFIIYFVMLISRREISSRLRRILFIAIHYGGWIYAYSRYGISRNTYEQISFSFVGVLFFAALIVAENERTKRSL